MWWLRIVGNIRIVLSHTDVSILHDDDTLLALFTSIFASFLAGLGGGGLVDEDWHAVGFCIYLRLRDSAVVLCRIMCMAWCLTVRPRSFNDIRGADASLPCIVISCVSSDQLAELTDLASQLRVDLGHLHVALMSQVRL